MRQGFLQYLPIGALVGLILLVELIFIVGTWIASPEAGALAQVPIAPLEQVHNTQALGQVLYTKYVYLFQVAGLVLLVAMIGAICLTLRQREGVRKQRISDQVSRKRADSVEIKHVTPGSGV
jgi:NADH-quinone oxidoreductase subunit J